MYMNVGEEPIDLKQLTHEYSQSYAFYVNFSETIEYAALARERSELR